METRHAEDRFSSFSGLRCRNTGSSDTRFRWVRSSCLSRRLVSLHLSATRLHEHNRLRAPRAAAAVHNPRRAPHKTPNHRTLRFAPPRSFFTLFFFSLICLRDFVTLAISSCRRTRCLGSNFFMASTVS